MHAQGLNQRAIADTLGLSRPTVRSFLRQEHFPERHDHPKDRHQGVVAAYLPFLRERWLVGCHNGRQLFREAKDQGYTGSRAQLERVTTEWRQVHFPPISCNITSEMTTTAKSILAGNIAGIRITISA